MQALAKITDKITEKARLLVDRYGVEVSMCARVLLSTLLPSGGHLAEGVSALCEYVAHKNLEINHEQVLEQLGDLKHDQAHVNKALSALLNQLNPLLEQLMDTRQAEGLQLDQIEALMKRQCLTGLSTQQEVAEVRRELLQIQPELTQIRKRSDEILSAQENTSAELREVNTQLRTLVDTMLSHSAPLNPRELTTAQRRNFYQLHARFHSEFLEQDIPAMEETLASMLKLAPYHSVTAICEAALSSLQRDFPRAQEAMSGLPDELIDERDLESVREAFSKLDSSTSAETSGDEIGGVSAWTQVKDDDEPSWALENLAQGWLLHTRATPRRAEVWSVVGANGEPGALHVLKGQLTRRGDYFRRFKGEISSLKSVDHPSVLRILDWGRTPERDPYLVTEPLRGETLEERLTRGRLSPNEMKQLGASLFESLEACHAQGVLHLNIHPCTIQFRKDNTPILVGFGVSCQELELDADGQRQDEFASPEQLRGEPPSAASDIYSLGAVLIDSVGGVNKIPKPWRETLTKFVNPSVSSRPSAPEVNRSLSELTSNYYVTLPGRAERGPYEVARVVELITQGHDELTVQRVGSLYRVPWKDVEEIATRARAALEVQAVERAQAEAEERERAEADAKRAQVDPFMTDE